MKHLNEPRDIRYKSGWGVAIGALATHNDLYGSPLLQERFLFISLVAQRLANHQVRNRGHVGGNLVNAIPSADLPPILVALDASLTLISVSGSRTVPLKFFFTGPSSCVLK